MRTTEPPKSKLKPGVIYSADNGRLICLECAGMTAKYTLRDTSGQRIQAVPYSETTLWFAEFVTPMACECGKTIYLLPAP